MENKTKLVYGIKGKLISAICMLLVAVIMVVSSTYAWFTLSTAPEVTGIQTAIGANGALEMALQDENGDVHDGTTTSAEMTVRNNFWGNLVDLTSGYGLDNIVLNPAALNAEGNILGDILLQTPTYGADGRPGELFANTVTAIYSGTGFNTSEPAKYGVRAVGAASGMTDRQLAYRNAKNKAELAMTAAKNAASNSLNANGSALANIAIKHATSEGGDTYTQDEIAPLKAIVAALKSDDGALAQIEEAYKQYILAYAASKAVENEEAWVAVNAAITGSSTLAEIVTAAGASIPAGVNTGITAYNASVASVEEAETTLNNLTDEAITWTDLRPALALLADPDAMKVNGFETANLKDNISELASDVMKNGVKVTMATSGGIYADIADQCGDYSAQIVIAEVKYGSLALEDVPASMQTATDKETVYLAAIKTAVDGAGAPDGAAAGAADLPITEFYGYVVDLAFRTNAADSNLLLQTAPKDRIYSDNDNPETLGKGSTMTFKSNETSFTNDKVVNLMKSVRVVFFNTTDKTILATAKLDLGDGKYTTGADGVTANLYLYTVTENEEDDTTEETLITDQNDATITALQQNTAAKISALVYLDGETITNADVAATSATSVTGTMNLQFSSSADLKPMEYSGLHTPGETDETSN